MRKLAKLSAIFVSKGKAEPGWYGDGGGLWLQVAAGGTRSWVFRFMQNGRARWMGLGSARDVSLVAARALAAEARTLVATGQDPLEARAAKRRQAATEAAKAITFADAAARCIDDQRPGWSNPKHAAQWTSTLEAYAYPVLGKLPVGAIETAHVVKVLEPIWTTKTETARRVRNRIETVLAWATVRGFRAGDNPARWKDHLDSLFAPPSRVAPVEHHAAMPWAEIGELMAKLRRRDSVSAQALAFLILTATRTSDVTGATWREIDLDAATWTIPGTRLKGRKGQDREDHTVPLPADVVALLREVGSGAPDAFVFSARRRKPLDINSMRKFLQEDLGYAAYVPHGFRSTFKDWASERTNYAREVTEKALAHTISDKVEAAYRRGELLEKRKRLMRDWAAFCAKPSQGASGKVVSFVRANAATVGH